MARAAASAHGCRHNAPPASDCPFCLPAGRPAQNKAPRQRCPRHSLAPGPGDTDGAELQGWRPPSPARRGPAGCQGSPPHGGGKPALVGPFSSPAAAMHCAGAWALHGDGVGRAGGSLGSKGGLHPRGLTPSPGARWLTVLPCPNKCGVSEREEKGHMPSVGLPRYGAGGRNTPAKLLGTLPVHPATCTPAARRMPS